MVTKLLPSQIPCLWEAIKFASISTDGIPLKDQPLYLNRLLAALLSEKAQCFVRLDDSRMLMALVITRLIFDEVTGEKSLFINSLYSFKSVIDEQWVSDIEIMRKFAIDNECRKIITYSNNPRIFDIVKLLGFGERFRCFIVDLAEV